MYKVVIVDDEPGALAVLSKMVNDFFNFEVIGKFSSPENLVDELAILRPDILFLDIHLGTRSGVDIAKELYKNRCTTQIVFVSAYDQYALKAFEYNIIDYILKPVSPDRLQKCIEKIEKTFASRSNEQPLTENISAQKEHQLIRFNTQSGFLLVNPKDIVFLEADHVYTKIVMEKESDHYVAQNIGKILATINSEDFVRISRSHVINTTFLREVNRTQKKCIMYNGASEVGLSISKSGMKVLEEYFG
ncbi:LytR/AlgR family response regulator transcription factor [Marinilabilia salmonicolor]|uniref:LytR/AlgR family response regulator transcription factor n=1 Tax=Marinilabilia salmonicolor TaxID=989 RepID=UPI00029A212C|nr:LytTR family DNA-binding domain-containing protein [Marinilabilia salmonicolor]